MHQAPSATWVKLTKPYQRVSNWKSAWQILNSFAPFGLCWYLAYIALQTHFLLMLPFCFLGAVFLLRIFIIQHDCGHATFFKSKSWRDSVGFLCSILTMTPYEYWQWTHNQHHAHNGDLKFRDIGEIKILTAKEYLALSRWERCLYRLYRHPIFLFFVAPFLLFFISFRLPIGTWSKPKLRDSVWITNLALLALFFWGSSLAGIPSFLLVHSFTVYFGAMIGVWIFYVQHQFEDGYWRTHQDWNYVDAALEGSSFFKLPRTLQWCTGNVGFHHIHHLSPLVPNYELERCHTENPSFNQKITTLTLRNCWETMRLRFWDEASQKMLSFKELYKKYLK